MDIEEVKSRLDDLIDANYVWPEVPAGWRLEFIVYGMHDIEMDLLHPVSATFWSDENEPLVMPLRKDGLHFTAATFQSLGIPFMTPTSSVAVTAAPVTSHLSLCKK